MSSEPIPSLPTDPLTLGDYISELIRVLGSAHPAALARMREVVGNRRARIVLDDEVVDVAFGPESLNIQPATNHANVEGAGASLDGEGATDSGTVLDLLDGYLEVTDAILDGRLHVFGVAEDVVRMFVAIEILLDASPRTPALQALAFKFQVNRRGRRGSPAPGTRGSWYPFACEGREHELLARLRLLPDASETRTTPVAKPTRTPASGVRS